MADFPLLYSYPRQRSGRLLTADLMSSLDYAQVRTHSETVHFVGRGSPRCGATAELPRTLFRRRARDLALLTSRVLVGDLESAVIET